MTFLKKCITVISFKINRFQPHSSIFHLIKENTSNVIIGPLFLVHLTSFVLNQLHVCLLVCVAQTTDYNYYHLVSHSYTLYSCRLHLGKQFDYIIGMFVQDLVKFVC